MKRRLEQIDKSIARYLAQLETADRHGDAVPEAKVARLKDKITKLKIRLHRASEQSHSLADALLGVLMEGPHPTQVVVVGQALESS